MIDLRGRFLFIKCVIDGAPYTLASVYTPNSGQMPLITDTLTQLNNFKEDKILLGCDLNRVFDLAVDKTHWPCPKHTNTNSELFSLLNSV